MATSSTSFNDPPTAAQDLASLLLYAQRIRIWATGRSFATYQANIMLRDATERNFIEIGNIIHRFERTAPHFHQQLPDADE